MLKAVNVSRETIHRLEIYKRELEHWQKSINLIASSTVPHLWKRHFEDSLQLLSYISTKKQKLIDLGSGAGFPGLVLAISQPETLDVTLIESDRKKCFFIENVSRETKTRVNILNSRIESFEGIYGDIITSRALAPLPQLLKYALPYMKKESMCLFLKGKGVEDEIEEAQKEWEFILEIFPSLTDSKGNILKITNLRRIPSDV
ncbi:MAG: 16S rRNA (guanine(527)-N(7))-methyltransferase RsmG [Alphaproteobacteria bacterium]|nr:16S rRNA (guanine(527)-N(7))-methyltransferase RsmG [Alphaproteobacteria bacterium]